jgi:hypothetical protein
MSVAAAAAEMPAGAAQREEALPEALLAILGYLVDDPKSLARAGAVGRAWREAAAANGESLWEQASTSIPLLDIMMAWIGFADEAKARPPCRRARHPIPHLNIGERRGVLRWARRRPLRRPRSTIAPSRTAPTSSALSLASPLPSPPPPLILLLSSSLPHRPPPTPRSVALSSPLFSPPADAEGFVHPQTTGSTDRPCRTACCSPPALTPYPPPRLSAGGLAGGVGLAEGRLPGRPRPRQALPLPVRPAPPHPPPRVFMHRTALRRTGADGRPGAAQQVQEQEQEPKPQPQPQPQPRSWPRPLELALALALQVRARPAPRGRARRRSPGRGGAAGAAAAACPPSAAAALSAAAPRVAAAAATATTAGACPAPRLSF